MRLIDADALIKTLEVANEELLSLTGDETELCLYDVIQIIKDIPAIDSVKRGEGGVVAEKWTDEQIRELLEALPPLPWEWVEDRWHGGWRGVVDANGEDVFWPVLDPEDKDIDRYPWFHEDELSDEVREFIVHAPTLVLQLLERAQRAELRASEMRAEYAKQ